MTAAAGTTAADRNPHAKTALRTRFFFVPRPPFPLPPLALDGGKPSSTRRTAWSKRRHHHAGAAPGACARRWPVQLWRGLARRARWPAARSRSNWSTASRWRWPCRPSARAGAPARRAKSPSCAASQPWDRATSCACSTAASTTGLPAMALELLRRRPGRAPGARAARQGAGLAQALDWTRPGQPGAGQGAPVRLALSRPETGEPAGRCRPTAPQAGRFRHQPQPGRRASPFLCRHRQLAGARAVLPCAAGTGGYLTDARSDYFASAPCFYYLVTDGATLRYCSACGDAFRAHGRAGAALRGLGALPTILAEDEAARFLACAGAGGDGQAPAAWRCCAPCWRAVRKTVRRHALGHQPPDRGGARPAWRRAA
jgi:hypothetical protein